MKRFFALITAFIILTACAEERPREYEFYNGFTRPPELEIPATDISGYKDTTSAENSLLASELQLEQLADHKLYEKKKAVVVQFYFHSEADHRQIETAREYAYETFWLGKVHTAHMLPYEDWQYSYLTKDLVVEIFSPAGMALRDTYTFDQLTDSGEKLYKKTTEKNGDILFVGTYIYLGDLLKGSDEQLAAYTDLTDIAGQTVHTSLRQELENWQLYAELLTEEKQIDPMKLNDIWDAVYERYSFINENIVIRLYVADKGMYYEYRGHIQLPSEE